MAKTAKHYSLSALDLHYLIKEWKEQDILPDARIDKIYQYDETVEIGLYKTGKGSLRLVYKMPSLLYTTEKKETMPKELPG
ncbi:MAG: hypothetical protein QW594_02285, partial [Candidatus Woesearchaeota archaeon]